MTTLGSPRPCVVACHQPDLLAYSGFWYKMARSDVMVLLPWDQYQKGGFNNRVRMRDAWCSLPLRGPHAYLPISEVRVQPGWQPHLVNVIKGRYSTAAHWAERGPGLCEHIRRLLPAEHLAEVNLMLIDVMRLLLGIETRVVLADSTLTSTGSRRVLDHVLAAGGTEYLSGTGAKAYMPDAEEMFASRGVGLTWSKHQRTTDDSVLTAYFDDEDPMATILREVPS